MNNSFRVAAIFFAAITISTNIMAHEKNHWTGTFGNPLKNGTNELYWKSDFCKNNSKTDSLNKNLLNKANFYQNAFFDFDKYDLKSTNHKFLDLIVSESKNNNLVKIVISGFTDSIGNVDYNKKLSELRAQSVKNYLINKGLKASDITIKGNGSNNPIANNSSEEGRAKNRRAEIQIFNK